MKIFPAIDLFDKKAVRLFKGDYNQMTVYSENPLDVAKTFKALGATQIHLVDLEGAKDGTTPNIEVIKAIKKETGLFCEVGGGIRSLETIKTYIDAGIDRVILGTAAVENRSFLLDAIAKYGEKIAVGVDIKDGYVAVKGWVEKSQETALDFCKLLDDIKVRTIICTDISKDGAMKGPNLEMYRNLDKLFKFDIIASGGVSNIEDIIALNSLNLYGAIVGKAYYVGAIDLKKAIEVTR
ncbi:MAG: 1-(5-phosphoribosyl)-5-[(5-phosphoribosylamino)methylideneamino]imidazole-4-carboxamide isomerase [Clostridiales bacterium]|nr:1-(5-phosphoribosyl)-5-[(5-phosphoribosylamino)methylideneamino]imidazole-4-carboxamide isomerase [Clostridiales bacterium]